MTDDTRNFFAAQLKELVPEILNKSATIDGLLHALKKFSRSSRTGLAVKLNRAGKIDLPTLKLPKIPFAESWFFGATSPDQSEWVLYGDASGKPRWYEFTSPD